MTYDYRRYNKYDQLKPDWRFWLTVVFLTRHVVGFVLVSMSASGVGGRSGGVGRDAIDLGGVIALIEPIYMIADIPVLVLLYALGARMPKSGAVVRSLWGAGRALIMASVAIYLALFALTRGLDVATYGPATWVTLALSALVAGYAARSGYLKDMFTQFPARADGAGEDSDIGA